MQTMLRMQNEGLWAVQVLQRYDEIWWFGKDEEIMYFEEVQRHAN